MQGLIPRLTIRRFWSIARIPLAVVLSLGLGWLAIRGLEWGLVGSTFQQFHPLYAVAALLVFFLSNLVRAYRWQRLFINDSITVHRLFVVQNEGIGLNNLVPVRVLSEATQFTVLTLRDRISGPTVLATLGMERVLDIVASTLVLGVAFVFIPEMSSFAPYVGAALVVAVGAIITVRLLAWGSQGLTLIRRFPFLADFAAAIAMMERRRGRLAAALVLSVGHWTLVGITAWIIAAGMDLSISPVTATLTVMGVLLFATALPAIPGALGTFDAAVVYVLAFFGIEKEAGFSYAVILHAMLFVPPTVMALVFLPGEGIGSFRRLQSLATTSGGSAYRPSS